MNNTTSTGFSVPPPAKRGNVGVANRVSEQVTSRSTSSSSFNILQQPTSQKLCMVSTTAVVTHLGTAICLNGLQQGASR